MSLPDQTSALKSLELDTLLDITNAINGQLDEKSLLRIYLFTLVANFKIKHLCVVENRPSGQLRILLKHHISESLETTILNFTWKWPDTSIYFIPATESEPWSGIEVIFKLQRQHTVQGYLFLGGINYNQTTWVDEKTKFFHTITNILMVAIQNQRLTQQRIAQEALKREMETAKYIQSLLFPKELPRLPEFSIYASYMPHQSVGGDYYDCIQISPHRFLICIADVSGKGISAAIVMSNFQAAMRILAKINLPLIEIVQELNRQVHASAGGEKYITAAFLEIDTENKRITYINAGHNPPILIHKKEKKQELLEHGTTILGAFQALPFIQMQQCSYHNGDILFAYTDGLIETSEHFAQTDEVIILLQSILHSEQTPEMVHQQIRDTLCKDSITLDDVTFLTCQL